MFITLDIRGTSIKYDILTLRKDRPVFMVQDEMSNDAKMLKGPGIPHRVESLIAKVMRQDIKGIAISAAGMADTEKRCIQYANSSIPKYTGLQSRQQLEACFHIPCWVESDVDATALGGAVFGTGKGAAHVLMLTIGAEIGGAVVIDHTIYRGCNGSAGEIGYMRVMDHHFQDIASITALIQHTEAQTKKTDSSGKIIYIRAKCGDIMYVQAIRELCSHITISVSSCICLMNPQIVIFEGDIMTQRELFAPLMEIYLKQYIDEEIYVHTWLALVQLGNRTRVISACAYWMGQEGTQFA